MCAAFLLSDKWNEIRQTTSQRQADTWRLINVY